MTGSDKSDDNPKTAYRKEPPDDPLAETLGVEAGDDEVVCRECSDRTFGQITQSHLRTSHGMTLKKYREKHPDAPIQSESVKSRSGWNSDSHDSSTRRKIAERITEQHKEGHYDADA